MYDKKVPVETSNTWPYAVMWDHLAGCLEPLMELRDNKSELVLTIDMPCVKERGDISVNLTEDAVTIEAKISKVVQFERWGTFQREAKFMRYSKTFALPEKIDPERSKARFKNNILELRMLKKEKLRSMRIE